MSVESMAIALHHLRSRGTTRLVLLGIANHDGDGGSWPTIATLATYAGGVSERSVQRAISELVALGEIAVHDQAGGMRTTRNDRRPNLYRVLVNCPVECDRTTNHRPTRGDTHVTPSPGRGVTPVTRTG